MSLICNESTYLGSEEAAMNGRNDKGDNRSNQMNPNNDAYWRARGWSSRPNDWKVRVDGRGRGAPQASVRK